MMTEISLNVLDVAGNSIRAGASLVEITVAADQKLDTLTIIIADNGCGMTEEQVKSVIDPFYTTRTTRKVGLGVPFFKQAAEGTGGNFSIESRLNKGTVVKAVFTLSHIDRMPLGDMTATMHTLITFNLDTDFLYTYSIDERSFTLDTRVFKDILEGIPFNDPEISTYIKDYLTENKTDTDNGYYL